MPTQLNANVQQFDGGRAFPGVVGAKGYGNEVPYTQPNGGIGFIEHATGMTLRDYFAANALNGLLSKWDYETADEPARQAYEYADAMLKARQQGNA